MPNSNVTVNFGLTSAGNYNTSIELDELYNSSYYPDEDDADATKTVFTPDEIAFLKVIPAFDLVPYTLAASSGILSIINKNVIYEVEESISFVLEDSASLGNLPEGTVSWEWVGNSGGTPLFQGSLITITEPIVGILSVTYNVLGDRIKLINTDVDKIEYEVLCVSIIDSDNVTSTIVNFDTGDDEEDSAEYPLRISVKDLCTDEPVPFALVEIEGLESGTADEDGIYTLSGTIQTGVTYNIITSATGYQRSDEDSLNNDSFMLTFEEDNEDDEEETTDS